MSGELQLSFRKFDIEYLRELLGLLFTGNSMKNSRVSGNSLFGKFRETLVGAYSLWLIPNDKFEKHLMAVIFTYGIVANRLLRKSRTKKLF